MGLRLGLLTSLQINTVLAHFFYTFLAFLNVFMVFNMNFMIFFGFFFFFVIGCLD